MSGWNNEKHDKQPALLLVRFTWRSECSENQISKNMESKLMKSHKHYDNRKVEHCCTLTNNPYLNKCATLVFLTKLVVAKCGVCVCVLGGEQEACRSLILDFSTSRSIRTIALPASKWSEHCSILLADSLLSPDRPQAVLTITRHWPDFCLRAHFAAPDWTGKTENHDWSESSLHCEKQIYERWEAIFALLKQESLFCTWSNFSGVESRDSHSSFRWSFPVEVSSRSNHCNRVTKQVKSLSEVTEGSTLLIFVTTG